MTAGINLTAIYIANAIGVVLMVVCLYGNIWRMKDGSLENRIIVTLMIFACISCIVDPLVFTSDGKVGILPFIMNYGGNWYLFFTNLIIGPSWIIFLSSHLNYVLTKMHRIVIFILEIMGVVLLVVNFFVPIVFDVPYETNIYERGLFYWFYIFVMGIILADGCIIYLRAKKNGGILQFFPIWVFILPVIIGVAIQSFCYGVSTIWPFIAVSVSGIISCLQNELIFKDKLTGLYNRFYLDRVKENLEKKKDTEDAMITAMMIDLNDFKAINDNHGHSMGDRALQNAAKIMRASVGTLGRVIRYAGDEFVVMINTQDDSKIEKCISDIKRGLNDFNEVNSDPYTLSISVGWSKLSLKEQTVDELMNEIDKKMFEDKRNYYMNNAANNRRRRSDDR